MSKHNGEVVEFDFQEIAVSEVPKLFPTVYRSRYAAFQHELIERVNTMASDKTFVFQPTKRMMKSIGKLSNDKIARICSGVNVQLARQKLNWKLNYAEQKEIFVLMPYRRKLGVTRRKTAETPAPAAPAEAQGFKDSPEKRMKQLVDLVYRKFKVTVRQLQASPIDSDVNDVRRAILYVGRNGFGLKLSDMAKFLEIPNNGTPTHLCQQATKIPSAKEKVNVLIEEVNKS